jgi:hypothetical protein
MTEAIIITAIIVGGIVALAGLVLHVSYKAWKFEREAEKQADDELAASLGPLVDARTAAINNEHLRYLSAN